MTDLVKPFLARDLGFVRLCGHRGHAVAAPENTLAALRATRAAGGSSAEIDTVLTQDGQIVVIHDLMLDRTTNGKGAVKDMTLAQIAALDAGSWFAPQFAGEPVPTLAQAVALAHELDLVLEVEVKEKLRLDAYGAALATVLADPRDLGRVMVISFDHAHLARLKRQIPGLRTGGIVHERFADPVAVARAADLDQLCIDLSVYELDDAALLHAAGVSIRCHAYDPEGIAQMEAEGLAPLTKLHAALRAGLIDTLSGDDVVWLAAMMAQIGPNATGS